MRFPIKYLEEVRVELARVNWPKRDNVVKLTALVITLSFIVAAYAGGLDYLFTKLIELILTK